MVPPSVTKLIALALEEDLGRGDLTAAGVPADRTATAQLVAKEACVASGLWLVEEILTVAKMNAAVSFAEGIRDGVPVTKGQTIFTLSGNARDLLSVERTLLNFLQRSFGIASFAFELRRQVGDFPVKITDTRKTLPGFRYLDKRAVRDGGLYNHRFGLDSGVLVKENHIRAAGGISAIVKSLRAEIPHGLRVEVEVTTRDEALEALAAGADALLLDNFSAADLKSLVKELREKAPEVLLEASGGINQHNIRDYAATGVDLISMGALTHSVKAADLSLQFGFQ